MKKLIMLITFAFFITVVVQAQVKPDKANDAGDVKIKPVAQPAVRAVKLMPAETKPAPPAVQNAGTVTQQAASVYKLTSARVNIRTGNDNKEFPSSVVVWLSSVGVGYALEQPVENLRNEMRSNSNNEFGLQNRAGYADYNRTLEAFQKQGLVLTIRYWPNLPTDAWKIEGVTLTVEFKDQFGNPHPTLGHKEIIFNNANGFLDAWNHAMICKANTAFEPLTASIKEM